MNFNDHFVAFVDMFMYERFRLAWTEYIQKNLVILIRCAYSYNWLYFAGVKCTRQTVL